MSARRAGSDAERTVTDFGLDRSGLRRARRESIAALLKTMRTFLNMDIPLEMKRDLAQELIKEAEAPTRLYFQAMGQNLRKLWCVQLPDVPLF